MNTIVVKCQSFVVVDLQHDLPRSEHWPYGVRWNTKTGTFIRGDTPYVKISKRKIDSVWVHHTGGGIKARGFSGPMGTAGYVVNHPRIVDGEPDRRFGRGWPGMPYHVYVSYRPERDDKEDLPVIYQCWPADWHIWHTKGFNDTGVGVVCQGCFDVSPGTPGDKLQPSVQQLELVQAAWEEWLKPSLGLTDAALFCHADAGKRACPGGTLRRWAQSTRDAARAKKGAGK